MRGNDTNQTEMFSYIPLEMRIPKNHPLRGMKEIIDRMLEKMSKDFDRIYSHTGRPSIPPEMLIRALFLQVLYGIRSERQIIEHLEFNLLYRWFVGLKADDKIWDETVFTKNRERLFGGQMIDTLFEQVIEVANEKGLLSDEHFTVDGTLVEAWASLKSLKKKSGPDRRSDDGDPGNPSVDFHGEKRSNKTHESETDPESRIYRKSKGQTAKLCYMGHLLMENRNGIAVKAIATQAGYYEEHNAAIDGRTTRHPGYGISQNKRKRVEEIFGWLKAFGIVRRPHFRGLEKIESFFKFTVSVYNILRIRNLTAESC